MKIFVNAVDEYFGKHLIKLLAEENHEVIASVRQASNAERIKGVSKVVTTGSAEWSDAIRQSDAIIYTLQDEHEHAKSAMQLLLDTEELPGERVFIGVSNVLTWANTPVEREPATSGDNSENSGRDEVIPLGEDEYRRRRAHPNYKKQIFTEKFLLRPATSKPNIMPYIVATGLLYGEEEDTLHFLFKAAWHCQPLYVIGGGGNNVLPTIHVVDAARIVTRVLSVRPEERYILAVDGGMSTLREIVTAINEQLGSRDSKHIVPLQVEAALLQTDLSQAALDMLRLDLRVEPGVARDLLGGGGDGGNAGDWRADGGIVPNIAAVVREFRIARGLTPLRVLVFGPPGSGRSTWATALAKEYKLHHIKPIEVVRAALAGDSKLAAKVAATVAGASSDKKHKGPSPVVVATSLPITQIHEGVVVRILRKKLRTPPCQNQGFVLDGFPETLEQAKALFGKRGSGDVDGDDDQEDEESEEDGEAEDTTDEDATRGTPVDDKLFPQFVVHLQATDEQVKERAKQVPESAVIAGYSDEEGFLRRLEQFRRANADESTSLLSLFDEKDVLVWPIDTGAVGPLEPATLEALRRYIGKPHNYGPTPEEVAAREAAERAAEAERAEHQRREREAREREERIAREAKEREWAARQVELKRQEAAMLEAQSMPFRKYLMAHVMPTLTRGLVELCKVRPEDPIDYLAEYLFKHAGE